ncbi:hypothetical protein L6452_20825 [Arctium lappa]|uniref:Uncharacterized protein n=1 Tax=Arctium lappa TaxID=4217 RepID=A0ACB9BDB3_ARCLA|nr:hypothetical protein L6452_20825 [Arctium lappa]
MPVECLELIDLEFDYLETEDMLIVVAYAFEPLLLIMEWVHGTSKASKFASEDIISNMPKNVITNILDRLPIQDAVRTGILSRSWRFNWTMLSQLVFDEKLFRYLQRKEHNQFYKRDLGRLLLHFRGFIAKFVLYIPDRVYHQTDDGFGEDINHWILFLSTKGMTEFVFLNTPTMLKLSTHLFSCLELKHLKLHKCQLYYVPGFHGFPNLLSLDFHKVLFESCICREFITGCPLLEILRISNDSLNVSCHHNGNLKLVEMAKLENLKVLSLSLSTLGHKTITHSDFFQLLGFFPKLEKLDLNFGLCKLLTEAGASTRFSSTLPCLKSIQLDGIDFNNRFMVLYVWDLIKGSSNLQTLKMKVTHLKEDDDVSPPPVGSREIDCGIIGKLQLRRVELHSIKDSEIDVCFIKSLLASSSLLEKMVIHKLYGFDVEEKYTFAKKLLKLHRASPIAEIDLD